MDARSQSATDDPLVITGLGHIIRSQNAKPDLAVDPTPYLKTPKLRKYMGVQDDLAVIAAARSLDSAGLAGIALGERTGLYLVVGCIPFEQSDIDPLLAASLDAGKFSMQRFSTTGFRAVNGLLTFHCLPNMPAFHISTNFGIQGPYFVTYPGAGQYYLALEEACQALIEGRIERALVAAVADQRNMLSTFHFSRLDIPIPFEKLIDAAGCLVLERTSSAQARGAAIRGRVLELDVQYAAHNPLEESPVCFERFTTSDLSWELGPTSLPVHLSRNVGASCRLQHDLAARDGLIAHSLWELA